MSSTNSPIINTSNAAYSPHAVAAATVPPSFSVAGTKKVFSGHIEVLQAANGYIVTIGRSEGYIHEVYVATSATEANEIIAAQIVAFRLEGKP